MAVRSYRCTEDLVLLCMLGSHHKITYYVEQLNQRNEIGYISYIELSPRSMNQPFHYILLMTYEYWRSILSGKGFGWDAKVDIGWKSKFSTNVWHSQVQCFCCILCHIVSNKWGIVLRLYDIWNVNTLSNQFNMHLNLYKILNYHIFIFLVKKKSFQEYVSYNRWK